ncbi:MAG: serine hydrolase [Bacillota bacterium]|uniref:serine hydrolase n=1 Tax=Virgibacillus TaxID=84406 RepID=UPI00040BA012|nr:MULTISPECIES: serine hydrolase [Bacillaceae]MCC2250134.1 D-alanyl-D-alanine carboxypeptidase [Virgibacillus sp. AGTR]MDY7045602.1 serine hydrolase [Virgibacillus sp. M23]QRZ19015.1 D-alanyl-D-alanine carboxypeptidase [Virgibacillus sp. AGTR]
MKHSLQKSFVILLAAMVMMVSIIAKPFTANAAETLDIEAESAILVDANTGKILFAKNADVALPPASMTKMMTEYLVWEAIEKGQISWDTTTQISDYPYSISANASFSGIGLEQSKDYKVKDLYNAMAINSDNATSIALAELIAGSEAEFVKMMNKKGEEMGLPDFKFVNSTGLDNESLGKNHPEGTDPNGTNLLSAESAALLAYHLVNDYPESLEVSSMPSTEFDGKEIRNWNHMLPHKTTFLEQFYYEGVDGLKTGYTDLAGYCFTGTAKKNNQRLISVVMQTDSEEKRFEETAKLFNYGFQQFESTEVFPAGHQVKGKSSLPVAKGKEDQVDISIKEGITIPIKPNEKDKYSMEYTINKDLLNKEGKLTAPIKKGEKIGTAQLKYKGENDYGYIIKDSNSTVDVVANETVEKSNWFMLTLGAIGDFFADLFTTVVDWVKGLF